MRLAPELYLVFAFFYMFIVHVSEGSVNKSFMHIAMSILQCHLSCTKNCERNVFIPNLYYVSISR